MVIDSDAACGSNDSLPTVASPSDKMSHDISDVKGLVEKSGWLLKKSSHLFRRWQWRFFVLKDKKLSYYHSQTDRNPSAIINFDQVTIDINYMKSKNEIILTPLKSNRLFKLKAASKDELLPWASAIIQHIEKSRGNSDNMVYTKRFWKNPRISQLEFLEQARNGDLLLFKSKSLPCTIQRKITGSKYDHVAMLIKVRGTVMFLEATRVLGVNVLLWDEFMDKNWHLLYKSLVYRKLTHKKDHKFDSKLAKFCDEVIGKKFRFKLTNRKKQKRADDQNGYFCSELIAAAYQRIGLMKDDISPSYFWPSYFADDKNLPLIDCNLSQECIIDFNL